MKNYRLRKLTDLMVGDYAYYDGNVFIEDEYEPSVGLVIVKINNGYDINLVIEECYYGIPLSDDSLAQFGFKKVTEKCDAPFNEGTELTMHVAEFDEQLSGDGVATNRVVVYPGGSVSIDSATGHVTVHCEYIHEIQHAMRVAGIKEELLLTESEPVKCLLHSSFQKFNRWHDNKKEDICDSFDDWEYHRFICLMKDGNVVTFRGICYKTEEGEIHKLIDCTGDAYDTDDIRFWIETPR